MKVYIIEESYYCSWADSTLSHIEGVYVNEADADKAIELLKSQNRQGRKYEHKLKESISTYPITQFQIGLYTAYTDEEGEELSLDDYYEVNEFKFDSSNEANEEFIDCNCEDADFSIFGYADKFVTINVPSNDEVKISKVKGLIMELVHEYIGLIENDDFVPQENFDVLLEKINGNFQSN